MIQRWAKKKTRRTGMIAIVTAAMRIDGFPVLPEGPIEPLRIATPEKPWL